MTAATILVVIALILAVVSLFPQVDGRLLHVAVILIAVALLTGGAISLST